MRSIVASPIRAPLFSRAALASSLLAGAAVLGYVAVTEAQGLSRDALVAVALLVAGVGVRWAWRVAARESERLR